MPRGVMVVQSRPSEPAREAEFNDWYDSTHLPEICAIPGFVAARRYRLADAESAALPYLAVYELDADDLAAPVRELRARSAAGRMTKPVGLQLDPPPVVAVYELITEQRAV